ncbi:hypothetical protein [Dyella sp.]|uniref:hypothetical protein n=1 Tax=Dyella sp. TaxID=1869338 RepID=UPI00284D979A|nr:hypothetical protein [Dyella sp.]MDR3443718.1 hypothetical protein [Dyella sp.]
MATAHGRGISESFLIAAEVFSCHEDETEGDLESRIIQCWDGISRPDQGHSIPLLPEDTLTLHSFAKTLFQRIRTSTAGVRLGPFEEFRGEVTYDRRPISQIDCVCTYNLSHRDIRVGRTLINRFVDKLAPKPSDDWVTWQTRRTAALNQQSAERYLLARTLSAMGALALMEQWTIQGWRAYAEEEGPGLQIFGHPLILLHEGPRPTAKVIRAMAVPEFRDPTPEQAISYRFASARYGGIHSSHYWEA